MAPTDDDRLRILVMDANERNAELLSTFLREEGYEPVVWSKHGPPDGIETDASQFAFALIDIDLFDDSVWSYCERLKEHDVPFVVLSGVRNPALRQESQEHGANAFIDKPIPKQHVRNLIEAVTST